MEEAPNIVRSMGELQTLPSPTKPSLGHVWSRAQGMKGLDFFIWTGKEEYPRLGSRPRMHQTEGLKWDYKEERGTEERGGEQGPSPWRTRLF